MEHAFGSVMYVMDQVAGVAMMPTSLVVFILIATFILEDVATIAIGLLAAQMLVDPYVALGALIAGTVGGDLALYWVGRGARGTRIGRRLVAKAEASGLTGRLRRRATLMCAAARFMPGFRLPIFVGAGTIGMPFARFAAIITATTLVWTPILFGTAWLVGAEGVRRFGLYGWLVALALVALALFGPRIARRIRDMARRRAPIGAAEV